MVQRPDDGVALARWVLGQRWQAVSFPCCEILLDVFVGQRLGSW